MAPNGKNECLRCLRQTKSLTRKNLKLAGRDQRSTCAQLFVGAVLLIVLVILRVAIVASSGSVQTDNADNKHRIVRSTPEVMEDCVVGPLADACYQFAVGTARGLATNDQASVDAVVRAAAVRLGVDPDARNISGGYMQFAPEADSKAIDQWIIAHPNYTRTVIVFENAQQWATIPTSTFRYTIQANYTWDCANLGIFKCTEPWLEQHVPVMTAFDAAFIAVFGNGDQSDARIHASFAGFTHPDLNSSFDVMKEYGALFLFVAFTFNFIVLASTIVAEKEAHIVPYLAGMGMMRGAYWASWVVSQTLINTIMVAVLMIFGTILNFDLFVKTDVFLLIVTLWLTSQGFTAMGLFLSTLTNSTANVRVMGVVIFVFTFITAPLLVSAFYRDPDTQWLPARVVLSFFPQFSFWNIIDALIEASAGSTKSGMRWEERTDNIFPQFNAWNEYWSVETSLGYLILDYFFFLFLAIYLDCIIPTEYGRALPVSFCLQPSFWGCKRKDPSKLPTDHFDATKVDLQDPNIDSDVLAEAATVVNNQFDETPAVVVRGLTKRFGEGGIRQSMNRIFNSFVGREDLTPCGRTKPPFVAVNRVCYSMAHGQLLALLGHNGSGKSTTFNMLTGLTNASDGDATIFGQSIRGDMSDLHSTMGVCPQHDILWGQLSAREHLTLFCQLKGLPEAQVREEVETRLHQVNLDSASDNWAGGYSGGMKRRLSIAIAMLGNPKIVFLDEPTTGMDPVTRNEVLKMISDAKQGRVIVLTSHAMEEVDMLADKICIMSRGTIQAVGSTLRLKRRFGAGFRVTVFAKDAQAGGRIQKFFDSRPINNVPTALVSNVENVMTFQLAPDTEANSRNVVDLFRAFEGQLADLGVADYSLSLSTLEDVFLNLSKSHEEEAEPGEEAAVDVATETLADGSVRLSRPEYLNVTLLAQWKALFLKSIVLQSRNISSCVFVVGFPILILVALIVLDRFVFGAFRILAMCGRGVSAGECVEKGPDLECVGKLFEQARPTQWHNIEVGRIDIQGLNNQGSAVNANCDAAACFEGLEKMDTRNISVTGKFLQDIGQLQQVGVHNDRLFELHADALFLMANTSCQRTFDDRFDEAKACDHVSGDAKQACKDGVGELNDALAYENAQLSKAFGIGSCLRDPNSPEGDGIKRPSNETLDLLHDYQTELYTCQADQRSSQLYALLKSVDIPQMLTETSQAGFGLMRYFSSKTLYDPHWYKLNKDMWEAMERTYIMDPAYQVARGTFFALAGWDPANFDVVPNLADLCSPQLQPYLALVMNDAQATTNLCAVANNFDLLRNTYTKASANTTELDLDIYKSWFGINVQTILMSSLAHLLPSDERYRARHFFAKFNGYDLINSDATKSQFDVVLYHNKSGVGNVPIDNWKELVSLFDSTAVRHAFGGTRDVTHRFKPLPKKFRCNRDAWLNGTESELKCDLVSGFLQYSIIDFVATQLFPFIFLLHTFLVVNMIVYEREARLRVIMRMNGGLNDLVYWSVSYVFFFAQFAVMGLVIFILGVIADLKFVSLHETGVYVLFIFVWGNCIVAFSLLLSTAFSSTKTSTAVVLLLVLITAIVGIQLESKILLDTTTTEASYASTMWFPPFVMIRMVLWMGIAGGVSEQIKVSDIPTLGNGALMNSLLIMSGLWATCLILTWYIDSVFVAGFGVGKHPLFCLRRSYWCGDKKGNSTEVALAERDLFSIQNPPDVVLTDINTTPDVKAEYERAASGKDPNLLVRIVRLHKRFGEFMAVRSISLGIDFGSCEGLLGHNGAGKTTAINMLVGLFPPTSGEAFVDSMSIITQMDRCQQRLGVAAQHDITWGPLSCREHVLFYGRLKGVPPNELAKRCDEALVDVDLKRFEHRHASRLSGGMRRRLSVAMALIGNPALVILDEPSTGLDPASKRALWNVISRAKRRKAIILTTHSLEEAEVLCDRMSIMALGQLQCVGTAADLKRRFGAGYSLTLTCKGADERNDVDRLVLSLLPGAVREMKQYVAGNRTQYRFVTPSRAGVVLSDVFERLESDAIKTELGLEDWGLSETTLEEVFLKLAELAHVQEALSGGDAAKVQRALNGDDASKKVSWWRRLLFGASAGTSPANSSGAVSDMGVIAKQEVQEAVSRPKSVEKRVSTPVELTPAATPIEADPEAPQQVDEESGPAQPTVIDADPETRNDAV